VTENSIATTIQERRLSFFCVFLFALAACVTSVIAEDVTAVFVAPTNSVIAGSRASVWLYLMNNSAGEVHRALEPKLNAKFVAPPVSWDAVLISGIASNEATIAPGAFAKAEYFVDVPPTLRGLASLGVSNYNEVMIRVVEPAETNFVETQVAPEAMSAKPPRTAIAKFSIIIFRRTSRLIFCWEIIPRRNFNSA